MMANKIPLLMMRPRMRCRKKSVKRKRLDTMNFKLGVLTLSDPSLLGSLLCIETNRSQEL